MPRMAYTNERRASAVAKQYSASTPKNGANPSGRPVIPSSVPMAVGPLIAPVHSRIARSTGPMFRVGPVA